MKKLLTLFFALSLASSAFAQQSVTTFLGIPVDGTKAAMRQKLINKGFRNIPSNDFLEGEFNGRSVLLSIVTNRDKVYRILVMNKNTTRSEADIRIHFNTLVSQFANNSRYIAENFFPDAYLIPEGEDISYKMNIENKRYQASFRQIGNSESSVWFMIDGKYGEYRIVLFYDNERNAPNGQDL